MSDLGHRLGRWRFTGKGGGRISEGKSGTGERLGVGGAWECKGSLFRESLALGGVRGKKINEKFGL